MSTIIDLLGGSILGGLVMMIALTASDIGMRQMFTNNADDIMQNNMNRMTYIMEFDIKKIGFAVPEEELDNTLQIAQPGHLKFLTQLNLDADTYYKIPGVNTFDASVDTIEFVIFPQRTISFGDTSVSIYGVRRTIKIAGVTTQQQVIGQVSRPAVFKYLDQTGKPVFTTAATRLIEIELAILNPDAMLTPELVMKDIDDIKHIGLRKKELMRILHPTFWRHRRLVTRNLMR